MRGQSHTFHVGANSDDDIRIIGDGQYRRAFHLRSGTATDGNEFSRETYAGNLLYTNAGLPAGNNLVLGSCPNVESDAIIFLVYNSNSNHQIWRFNTIAQTFTLVIQSSFLNFASTDYISHCFVNNQVLYWCTKRLSSFTNSNYVEPKNLDILEAIKFTAGQPSVYTTITRRTFDFIKWPPVFGPSAVYATDTNAEANYLYGKLYKFRYKYIYVNNEESVLSPYSELPLPNNSQYVQGRDWASTQDDNVLQVSLLTGPDLVKKIVCYVSINDGPMYEFKQLDKSLLGISNNTTYVVDYVGNETLQAIGYTPGNYDAVPLTSECMEMLPSRQIAFGNFIEGFNKEAISASISCVPIEISKGKFLSTPIGYVYLKAPTNASYISPSPYSFASAVYAEEGDTYTFITVYLGITKTIQYSLTAIDITNIYAQPTNDLQKQELCNILGSVIDFELGITGSPSVFGLAPAYRWAGVQIFLDEAAPPANVTKLHVNPTPRKNNIKIGLFKGATHEFGIQYYDRANRDGTVWTSDAISLYVPAEVEQDRSTFFDPQSPYHALARLAISNQPPSFATHYQIVHRRVPVIDFQERTGINIQIDSSNTSLLKISLDPYSETINSGIISHNIQKGDVVRFIRQAAISVSPGPADYGNYCETYVELVVENYNPSGGINIFGGVCESISVTNFDYSGLLGGSDKGFIVQIYTPAKKDENAVWREISEEFEVMGAHTALRVHKGSVLTGTATDLVTGTNSFSLASFLVGYPGTSFTYLIGRSFTIVSDVTYTGTITNASFNAATQLTTITASTNYVGLNTNGTVTITLNQSLIGPQTAILNLSYGDVYARIRQMATGIGGGFGIDATGYYPIDSFDYSDYYPSKINAEGRIAVEKPDARQVNQKAVIRHGGSFIDNSQVNNLCSFDQTDLQATLTMDETFGSINKMIINGYTLKCLQDRKENSVYIKSTFGVLPGGSTQAGFTPQSQTFGGWNPSESLFGTIHPFSVQLYNGMLFYYDYYTSTVIRSYNNGQQDICSGQYKYSKAIQDFKANLNTIVRGTDWVSSYIDESNSEYALMSFNRSNGNNVLSYVFNFERNRWDHNLRYTAFMTCRLGNYLVSWPRASAQLYKHNAGNENTFYGTQHSSELSYILNEGAEYVKRPYAVGLRTNAPWTLTALTEANASYPAMATTIANTEFKLLEGYYWAEYNRDETNVVTQIPSLSTTQLARINGRELRAYAVINTITVTPSTRVKIFAAKTNYELSEMPL